jgi:hypothetical protein
LELIDFETITKYLNEQLQFSFNEEIYFFGIYSGLAYIAMVDPSLKSCNDEYEGTQISMIKKNKDLFDCKINFCALNPIDFLKLLDNEIKNAPKEYKNKSIRVCKDFEEQLFAFIVNQELK